MQEDTISEHTLSCPLSSKMAKEYAPSSPAHIANPYAFYARARQEEPVFYSPSLNMWIVTNHKDVTTILKDHQRFSIVVLEPRPGRYSPEVIALLKCSPLSSVAALPTVDPPEHSRLRSCANKVLSAKRIAGLAPHMRHVANQLIDKFESQKPTEFMAQFARPYPLLVVNSLIGVPEADTPQMKVWVEQTVDLLFADLPAEQQLLCAQGWVAQDQYLYDLAERGRIASQDTFIGDLLKTVAGQEPLSTAEAAALFASMFRATIIALSGALGSCLYHLLTERHHWQTILDDPHLIPTLVEENLRLDNTNLGSLRRTNEAVELGGKSIPEGALIQVLLASANHDEAVFPDAATFQPHRENLYHHVSFGYGVHFCAGAPLARLAMRIALEQLSQQLPSLHLVPDQEISYTGNMVLHALKQLLLVS